MQCGIFEICRTFGLFRQRQLINSELEPHSIASVTEHSALHSLCVKSGMLPQFFEIGFEQWKKQQLEILKSNDQ